MKKRLDLENSKATGLKVRYRAKSDGKVWTGEHDLVTSTFGTSSAGQASTFMSSFRRPNR